MWERDLDLIPTVMYTCSKLVTLHTSVATHSIVCLYFFALYWWLKWNHPCLINIISEGKTWVKESRYKSPQDWPLHYLVCATFSWLRLGFSRGATWAGKVGTTSGLGQHCFLIYFFKGREETYCIKCYIQKKTFTKLYPSLNKNW